MCFVCFLQCNENIPSFVLNRLIKEVKEYTKAPVSDIKLQVNEENFTDLRAEIAGPAETPFHGGLFQMKLVFGPDFPSAPPKGYFITPIFHPNVAKNGEICVNTLKKDWKSDCKLSHILMVVRCLLIEPNPESALNEEAGTLSYAPGKPQAASIEGELLLAKCVRDSSQVCLRWPVW